MCTKRVAPRTRRTYRKQALADVPQASVRLCSRGALGDGAMPGDCDELMRSAGASGRPRQWLVERHRMRVVSRFTAVAIRPARAMASDQPFGLVGLSVL